MWKHEQERNDGMLEGVWLHAGADVEVIGASQHINFYGIGFVPGLSGGTVGTKDVLRP